MLNLQHNVVNILYAIKGTIEAHLCRFQENRFRDRDEALANAHEVMARLYKQAERALLITKKVSLAMKMAKKSDGPLSPVSIHDSWQEVVRIVKEQYRHMNGLEIIRHIPKDFPKILCNQNDLTEILYCLADNAVQAMRSAGKSNGKGTAEKLIIRTTLAHKSGEDPIANITIADTGPGMPEETLCHLFEPFVTTKPMDQGNGLGLCLVKGLVRKNGGAITVSSYQGCGTTFTLSFAVAKTGSRESDKQFAMS